jgi:hypothetical protein
MITIVVLSLGLFVVGACCCGGVAYMMASAPDADVEDERMERDGMTEGLHGTTDGCIAAAHARSLECGVIDSSCALAAETFLRACLRAVPSPDRSICDGVPLPSALGDWDFADDLCRRHGWAFENGECDPVADALSVYCHGQ